MMADFHMRYRALPALVGLLFLVAGCGGKSGPAATMQVDELLQSQHKQAQEVKERNARLFSRLGAATPFETYVISEGDLLEINIFEASDLNTTTRVSARGSVTLPLVGPVDLKGLTTREAEEKIETLYRTNYIRDPHVNLFVKEQLGGKITILGAVEHPGTYDYFNRRRLLDVLALAGGLNDRAGKLVQLRRAAATDPAQPESYLVDLDQLIEEGHAELNLEIQRGDVVFVPDAGVVYVDGAVRKPGSYPIKESMSVREAVVLAGGFSLTADESHVKVIRDMGTDRREVVDLSLDNTGLDNDDKLRVQDGDIVFVETDRAEKLIYSLRITSLFGLIGFGYTPPPQSQ